VTSARRVGEIPAQPFSLELTFRRSTAFACAGVLAALNAQADQIITALTWQSPLDVLTTLGGIAAVIWLAMYAALKVGFEHDPREVAGKDSPVLFLIVALSLLPISYAAQAGLLLGGAYLLATSRAGDASRRVSLILLALTGPLLWGRLLLQLFGAQVLSLDAHIVAGLIGTNVDGNVVSFATTNRKFLIGAPCSSVHNMSLAIVLWTTAAVLFDLRVDRRYLGVGLAMVACMFALNIARLAAIGLFPAHFDFLHTGAGADLFGWTGLIGAGLLAAMGVTNAARRQR
jgi:exosortase/archaeosortase family protein